MSIQPICDRCKKELIAFGAILFSPPNKDGHICEEDHLQTETGCINVVRRYRFLGTK